MNMKQYFCMKCPFLLKNLTLLTISYAFSVFSAAADTTGVACIRREVSFKQRLHILIVLYFHTPSLPLSFFFSLVITRQPTELFDPTALIWNISSDQISLFLSFSMSSLDLSSSRRERGEVHWPERLPFQPEAKQSLTRV